MSGGAGPAPPRRWRAALDRLWPRRIRTQLIVGVALVHLLLMTVFVVDLVERQRRFLRAQSQEQTEALASALAITSSSWVLANDVVGLGEVVQAVRRYPGVRYAMIVSREGQVLAHTHAETQGAFASDPRSLALLSAPPSVRTVSAVGDLLDVAAPVLTSDGTCIGWARVGMGQERISEGLSAVSRNGVLYTVLAILLGSVFAVVIGSRLTAGLSRLLEMSSQVRDGRRDVRTRAVGGDEIGVLGQGLDEMLDALAAGEERIRLLLDSTLEGILGFDLEGRCTFCNPAALSLLGYGRAEELLGQPLHERIHHHRRDGTEYPRSECPTFDVEPDGAEPRAKDDVYWRADGTSFLVELRACPISKAGRRVGTVVTFSDITERRRAEKLLTEQSQLLESYFQHTRTGLVLLDRDFRFLRVNETYAKACQREPAEFIGKSHFQLYPSEELEGRFREVVRTGTLYSVEGRPFSFPDHPERGITYWDLSVVPIRGYDGEVEFIVFSLNDVTERRKADEERRRAALYVRSLLEASLDPLVTISPEGKITDVSAATEAITGLNRRDLVGSDFSDYFTEPGRARKGYQRVLAEGAVRDYPLTIRHTSGRTTDVLYNATVYRNEAGEPQGVFAAARDVTELVRAEGEIRRLNEDLERRILERTAELEAANRELEAFSYSVSHDLRAPLRAVDGFSRIVLEEFAPELPRECQDYLALVRENSQQMGRLIDDLLSFSRLGRQSLALEEAQPADLVKRCLLELRPELDGRKVETTLGDLPSCQADPALLKQVWVNLLSNALKFTRKRDVARIEVGSREIGGRRAYFVKDNGVGFDMRYVGKLFGVFQRLHRAEEYEGTGVGLAIVQRIVRRHGGRTWAEAEVDRGATFYFTLEGGDSP